MTYLFILLPLPRMNIKREVSKVSKKLSLPMTRNRISMVTVTSQQQISYPIHQGQFLRYFNIFVETLKKEKLYPTNNMALSSDIHFSFTGWLLYHPLLTNSSSSGQMCLVKFKSQFTQFRIWTTKKQAEYVELEVF